MTHDYDKHISYVEEYCFWGVADQIATLEADMEDGKCSIPFIFTFVDRLYVKLFLSQLCWNCFGNILYIIQAKFQYIWCLRLKCAYFHIDQKWRRRWFALRQSGELPGQYFLDYYADRNCRRLKGTINLDLCEQVSQL